METSYFKSVKLESFFEPFHLSVLHMTTFMPPFAPLPLRRFSATMGALTPVALPPASRQRSYSRLQAGERIPGEDFLLSDHARSQAH